MNDMMHEAVVDGKLAELMERASRLEYEIQTEINVAARRNTMPNLDALEAKLAAVHAEAAPLEEEFNVARWPRWFPCLNTNGHVHATLTCASLQHDTRMGWATTLSGRDAASVVAEYGTDVCSVCVPEAPALPQPAYGSKAAQERDAARLECILAAR